MAVENLFDRSPVWLLCAIVAAWLLLGCEAGYRLGSLARARWPESGKVSAGPVMGAALGLLAFLLAFTFGMSSTRFDARRQLVLDEASAILVVYQRAQSLPEPHRSEFVRLVREYVEVRLLVSSLTDFDGIKKALTRSEGIQDALWARASLLGDQPGPVQAGMTQSLAVLTDLQIKRVRAAVWNRIPAVIVLALFGIAFLALASLGFNSGLNERRPVIPAVVIALAFSCIITLIIDLERPRQQLFSVSQEPMEDVARRIQSARP